jgi:uncharacterized protein
VKTIDQLRREHSAGETRTAHAEITWDADTRADGNARRVSGHAVVFNRDSVWMGFTEQIAPGAFRNALARPETDPYLLLGHNPDAILGRSSAGTLQLREDAHGLHFSADVVDTALGRDVVHLVRSGHLTGCSFGFTVAADEWEERDGKPFRRILEVGRLLEVTLTPFPAYPDTEARDSRTQPTLTIARARMARARALAKRSPDVTAPPTITVREPDIYGPERDRQYSYFRDLQTVAVDDAMRNARIDDDIAGGSALSRDVGSRAFGEVTDDTVPGARRRLFAVAEARANQANLTAGTGGEFATPGGGVPGFVRDAFATSARIKAAVAALLPHDSLENYGKAVQAARITSGAAVGVQANELDAPSTASLATALASDTIGTISGTVDLTQQLVDRGNFDVVIAEELGKTYGERLELQVINGSGASGQLRGLLLVAGIASTYVDATPTPAKVLAAVGSLAADVATQLGYPIDTIIAHERRDSWLETKLGYTPVPWPGAIVTSMGVPTNLGAGTEDTVIALARNEVKLFSDGPVFRMDAQPLGGTLQVRALIFGYAALMADRQPKAVGKLTGTGLIAPTF